MRWDTFSYTWTCVIILVIEFILTLRRDLEIYVKINSYGVIGIIILTLFTMTNCFIAIT